MRFILTITLTACLALGVATSTKAFNATAASDLVSRYRISKGLKGVRLDPALNHMAQIQATAMAAQDTLSHDSAGSFRSRMIKSSVDAMRAAENIAYGSTTFEGSLRQWQQSPGHNVNLLMPSATRFGVATATSSSGRMYWAMVVASDPPPPEIHIAGPYGQPQPHRRRAIRTKEGASMIMPFNLFGNEN